MTFARDRRADLFGGWLLLLGLGYAVFHHAGVLFAGLGGTGETRWADWIDLATPFVVIGAATGALRAARASGPVWALFWFGAVLYVQGQGIHLAANSVSNAAPGEPAHLWDEVVGHYLWYSGFTIVMVALAVTLHDRRPRGGLAAYAVAVLVGFTHFTNSVEGQTVALGIATAACFALWGAVSRFGMGRYLLTAYGVSLVLFAVFGVWQGGFPEFSKLGWI